MQIYNEFPIFLLAKYICYIMVSITDDVSKLFAAEPTHVLSSDVSFA